MYLKIYNDGVDSVLSISFDSANSIMRDSENRTVEIKELVQGIVVVR